MTEQKHDDARGASTSDAGLGAAVLVDGKVIAWFVDFNGTAEEWCTENHFGRWLAWRATPPEIVPLTPDEYEAAQQRAAEFATLFEPLPEVPND